MTNETNMGTYLDLKNDRMYVAQEGLFVPLGGETANPGKGAVRLYWRPSFGRHPNPTLVVLKRCLLHSDAR